MWNSQQREAIETKGKSILVSAGAGSGKTAVLTQRIVQLIEQGHDILSFAVCTFTEAATMEMKGRIRDALMDKGLYTQADSVYLADISTIHSLCTKIIKENFDVVNLPPRFTVLTNEGVVKNRAMDNSINRLYDEDDEFLKFAMKVSPKGDEGLRDILIQVFDYVTSIPDYREFFEKQIKLYSLDNYDLLIKEYCDLKIGDIDEVIDGYNNMLKFLPVGDDDALQINSDLAVFEEAKEAVKNGKLGEWKLGRKRSNLTNDAEIKSFRDEAKKTVLTDISSFKKLIETKEIMDSAYNDVTQIYKGVDAFIKEYDRLKLEEGYLTYNDLERYAYMILGDDEVSRHYRERYEFVFVDEYQDTSRLQQAIIDRLKRHDNVFMVGDIKQSIYGFRNADPTMFQRIYKEYSTDSAKACIELPVNYRSEENILNCVNDIFSKLLNLTDNLYPPAAYLRKDSSLDKDDKREDVGAVDIDLIRDNEEKTAEAYHIVGKVEQMLKQGYKYKDIGILFRKINWDTVTFVYNLLREKSIPVVISKSLDTLFMESRVFMDLLSIIDNPDNDIPLISVLFSSLGGFSLDDLIKIKTGKKDSFYKCVIEYEGDKDLKTRLDNFMSMLRDFNVRGRNMSVDELMSAVLIRTGYIKLLEAHQDSFAKISQIYGILKNAKDYEEMGYVGLSGFLDYQKRIEGSNEKMEIEGFSRGSDAVRIMTIHKSKGLAFPVVILGGMGGEIHSSGSKDQIFINRDIGLGISHVDDSRNAKIATPVLDIIKRKNKVDALDEEMRMLYVAMTRPKEKLIITGIISQRDKEALEEIGYVKKSRLIKGKAHYIDALLLAYYDGKNTGNFNINVVEALENRQISTKEVLPQHNAEIDMLLNQVVDISVDAVPKKASVTGLTRGKTEFVPFSSKDIKSVSTGALAGTVTHGILSLIKKKESVDEVIERMRTGQYFTENELKLVDKDMLQGFLDSSLYKRMIASNKVFLEKAFMLDLPANSKYAKEPVMVQGIIDCMFLENGEYILVDYKTDNVVKNVKEVLIERYSSQLELYAYAIEQLTGVKVKEKILYHLRTKKEFVI